MATKKDGSRQSLQSVLVGIVIGAAMYGAFYMLYYTPTNKKIESTQHKIDAKNKALETVRTQAPLLKPSLCASSSIVFISEITSPFSANLALYTTS